MAKVLEAVNNTDAAGTAEGQENLKLMYEALTRMDINMASIFKHKSVDERNTTNNVNEQEAILAELKRLVTALNNN